MRPAVPGRGLVISHRMCHNYVVNMYSSPSLRFFSCALLGLMLPLFVVPHSAEAQTGPDSPPGEQSELLVPLIRLEHFMMTVDTFPQFARGQSGYQDTIYELFRLGFGPYEEGQGTLFRMETGTETPATLRREVLSVESDGSRWWRIEWTSPTISFSYEALVDPTGVPFVIRTTHPTTGETTERTTYIGESFKDALDSMSRSEIEEAIASERQERIDEMRRLVEGTEIVGNEEITTPAGTFSAVHLARPLGPNTLHYWVALDVPGQLLRMALTADPAEDEVFAQLMEIYDIDS